SQSAWETHDTIVALGSQNKSTGPAAHSPSSPTVGVQVASSQALGWVGIPGTWQAPPGHSVEEVHGAQMLPPPRQRLPPQIVAPTAMQSAFEAHAVAAALLQVSHRHLLVENATA